MKEAQYIRKANLIHNVADNTTQEFKSINQAKKHSRALQGSALGNGLVRVEQHKQKRDPVVLHKSYMKPMPGSVVIAPTALEQAEQPKRKAKIATKKAKV